MISFSELYINLEWPIRIVISLIMICASLGGYLYWSKVIRVKVTQQKNDTNKITYSLQIWNKMVLLFIPMSFIVALFFLIIK